MMDIIGRDEAREVGLNKYFTGEPCLHGHITERFTKNTECVGCRRVRWKTQYEKNKEKYKARAKAQRDSAPEEYREYQRKYSAANKDSKKLYDKEYYRKNGDTIRDRAIEFRNKNIATEREKRRSRYRENPEYYKTNARMRKARLRGAPGKFTAGDVAAKMNLQGGLCYYCKVPVGTDYHIDHKIPVASGGTNWPANICVACADCNLKKSDRSFWKFREAIGVH